MQLLSKLAVGISANEAGHLGTTKIKSTKTHFLKKIFLDSINSGVMIVEICKKNSIFQTSRTEIAGEKNVGTN